jgi:hypothetical protein
MGPGSVWDFAVKPCFAAEELGPRIQRADELHQPKAVSTRPSTFVAGRNGDPKPNARDVHARVN